MMGESDGWMDSKGNDHPQYLQLLVIQLLKLVLVLLLHCIKVVCLISGAAPLDRAFVLFELDS